MNKLNALLDYLTARLSEQTTWQGIGFFVAACGSHFGAGMLGLGGLRTVEKIKGVASK